MSLYETKVTRQGQATIPKPIRDKYGIEEGDEITYIDMGDHIEVVPKIKNPLEVLRNIAISEDRTAREVRREALDTASRIVEEGRRRGDEGAN